jgi:hypothetical protein
MTATDQEIAGELAAQELAKRVAAVAPLADPLAFARSFIAAMRAEHWKCIPPPPSITPTREGAPPNDDWLAAKAAITRKDDHDA